jgi:hypothetical protein
MENRDRLMNDDARNTDADEELATTAESWREPLRGTDVEEAADEIARGAENAARQPGYGREGQ